MIRTHFDELANKLFYTANAITFNRRIYTDMAIVCQLNYILKIRTGNMFISAKYSVTNHCFKNDDANT